MWMGSKEVNLDALVHTFSVSSTYFVKFRTKIQTFYNSNFLTDFQNSKISMPPF